MEPKKRYWLRGAWIGIFVLFLGYILAGSLKLDFLVPLFQIPWNISKFLFKTVLRCSNEDMVCGFIIIFGTYIIFYALIGTVCGYLYGKYKNRNKV